MLKECVILDGQIINIGKWDYKVNDEGVASNPMPEGATTEEREFEYTEEYGWREIGYVPEPAEVEKLQQQIETMQGAIDFVILNY